MLAVSCCSLSACGWIAERYVGAGMWGKRRQSCGRGSGEELGLHPVKAASRENGCRAILGAFGNAAGSQRPAGLFGDDSCPDALWHIKHTLCCPALTLQITAWLHSLQSCCRRGSSASPHPQCHSLGMERNPWDFPGLRGVPTSS